MIYGIHGTDVSELFIYYPDRIRNQDGSKIHKTVSGFRYLLSKDRKGFFQVKRE